MRESIIRTFVPLLVGLLGQVSGWLGWTPDEVAQVAGLLVAGLYYLGVRLLEQYVAPRWGWLLGLPRAPQYAQRAGTRTDDTGNTTAGLLLAAAAVLLLVAASAAPALAAGRRPLQVVPRVPEIVHGIAGCGTDARTLLAVRVLEPQGAAWVVDPDGPRQLRVEGWFDGRWVTPPQAAPDGASLMAGARYWRWRPYLAERGHRVVTGPEYRLQGDTCAEFVPAAPAVAKAA
jgi:hypothetical protein